MEVMDKQCVTQLCFGEDARSPKGAMADRGAARSFYEHIKARRVDPSYQSVNVSPWLAFSWAKPQLTSTSALPPVEPDARLLR